jgi:hypothetical protein
MLPLVPNFGPLMRRILKTLECPGLSFDRERATKVGRDAAASLPILIGKRLTARVQAVTPVIHRKKGRDDAAARP